LLGAGLKVRPARLGRHPEDVVGEVFVGVFRAFGVFGQQLLTFEFEPVRDVLEEDKAKGYML
jgi:hypothetical protein